MKKTNLLLITLCLVLAFSTASFAQWNEAPELAEKVAAGELEQVEDRLPLEPFVADFSDRDGIGQYGGVLNTFKEQGHGSDWDRFMHENAFTFGTQADYANVYPNLFKGYDVNEDATEYIFYMREGLKWSDGEPLTAEDVGFSFEHIWPNEYLANMRGNFYAGGEPAEFEMIDEYTYKITFAQPYGTFVQSMSTSSSLPRTWIRPKHYLSQFHPDFVDVDQIQEWAEEEGFEHWHQLFAEFDTWREDVELLGDIWRMPTINPWIVTGKLTDSIRILERNPYYWKVDEAGNQLPYIDEVRIAVLGNSEVAITQTLTGRYNFVGRYITTMENRPLFQDAVDSGRLDMEFHGSPSTNMNTGVIMFNLTHEDQEKREIFANVEFKKAMSHGINRDDIIETLLWGMAEPRQPAPLAASAFSHEEYANAYLEYDPAKSNAILDELGFERGTDGMRRRPSGERFQLHFVCSDWSQLHTDITEMIVTTWRNELGIDVQQRVLGFSGYRNETRNNNADIGIWHGDGGVEVLFDSRHYIPSSGWSAWGPLWQQWYNSDGETGEEPPEHVMEMIEWYDEGALLATDVETQQYYLNKLFDRHLENLFVIGTSSIPDGYMLSAGNLKNVPDWNWSSWVTPSPANAQLDFFYIEN